ncbi:hypothetical protein [Niabella ginsengisoli]|uniref:CPBP family intramembrane metalloprotease n=1 Tax=Niabella ginsengisoli TaxID=522298 RepID=A0ABS9SMW8_9BACT|nr:hypothetical protein [Niabella ginsengisoli]MCH5599738.1 hypothetical protein [Niabella ginsengisoli]
MNTKLPISEKLILIAAVFCTVWIAFMLLSAHYYIDIGIVGGAIWELITIPVLLTTPLIFLYTLYAIFLKSRGTVKLLLPVV